MKNIADTIHTLKSEQLVSLAGRLGVESSAKGRASAILASLLSFSGLHALLRTLTPEEMMIFADAFGAPDGITFGEIEKSRRIDTVTIEKISDGLTGMALVYVLKNRQRLHNKLDKIYIFPELRDILRPAGEDFIAVHAKKALHVLDAADALKRGLPDAVSGDAAVLTFVETLYAAGGILTIEESSGGISRRALEQRLTHLENAEVIDILHDVRHPFDTYIVLKPEYFPAVSVGAAAPVRAARAEVDNRFYFLLNMLTVFDIVTSSGLFLTKQKEFRKIDWKRLSGAMLTIRDADGEVVDPDTILQLCLFLLNQMRCVGLRRDAVVISFKRIEKDLENPLRFTLRILKQLHSIEDDGHLFAPPYELPSPNSVQLLIESIAKLGTAAQSDLYIQFMMKTISAFHNGQSDGFIEWREKAKREFHSGVSLLCVLGIVSVSKGNFALSEMGQEAAARIIKHKKPPEKQVKEVKNIYINPDFTILIPKNEVPAEAGYHLLAHTDIIKDDVVLHTRISRNSIMRASKRGMTQVEFLNALRVYSKNELPQNLTFLIAEWSRQTIHLKISDVTLLHASHPALIDELSYGDAKTGIMERLSPNFAIIDRKRLDALIKAAQKKDAVISLFEDDNED